MPYRETHQQCPRCGGILDGAWSAERARLECSICHGRFLGFVTLRESHAFLVERLGQRASIVPAGPMGCPLCDDAMRSHLVETAERHVAVDFCGRHGVWFDSGEMEALARAIRAG